MSPTTIALLLISGVALLAGLAVVNHRLETLRQERLKALGVAQKALNRSWAILDNVHHAYLVPPLRRALAHVIDHQLSAAREVDRKSPELGAQATRLAQLREELQDPAVPPISVPPTAEERRRMSALLRDLKRLTAEMAQQAVLSHRDARTAAELCEAALTRVVVDHYKANARNSEQLGRRNEALRYLMKAKDALDAAPGGEHCAAELNGLQTEVERLEQLIEEAERPLEPEHEDDDGGLTRAFGLDLDRDEPAARSA